MSKFLFEVQQKNRLKQKGLLRRFSVICYGHQESVEELRSQKAAKYKELKDTKNKKDLEEWFLNYKPDQIKNKEVNNSEKNSIKSDNSNSKKYKGYKRDKNVKNVKNVKKIKKTKKTNKTNKTNKNLFFNIYGKRTRKNKKGLY